MKNLTKSKGYKYLSSVLIEYIKTVNDAKENSNHSLFNAISGIISAIISNSILKIILLGSPSSTLSSVTQILYMIFMFLILWVIFGYISTPIDKFIRSLRKIDLKIKASKSVVSEFNNTICYQVVLISELILVFKTTATVTYKKINFIEITQIWCSVIIFIYNNICPNDTLNEHVIRTAINHESYKYIDEYINIYTLLQIMCVLDESRAFIAKQFEENNLQFDCDLSLLKNDFDNCSRDFNIIYQLTSKFNHISK